MSPPAPRFRSPRNVRFNERSAISQTKPQTQKIIMKITFALCAFLLAGGLALKAADKADKPKADPEAAFKKLDTNSDGKLSKDEFLKLADNFKDKEKARKKLTDAFEMIDTDKMGLSIQQFRTYFEKARKKVEKAKEK
jgi:hypothetical protein